MCGEWGEKGEEEASYPDMINLGMREALINNECEKKTAYLKKAWLKPMRLNPGPLFHPMGQGALPEILKEMFEFPGLIMLPKSRNILINKIYQIYAHIYDTHWKEDKY